MVFRNVRDKSRKHAFAETDKGGKLENLCRHICIPTPTHKGSQSQQPLLHYRLTPQHNSPKLTF